MPLIALTAIRCGRHLVEETGAFLIPQLVKEHGDHAVFTIILMAEKIGSVVAIGNGTFADIKLQ